MACFSDTLEAQRSRTINGFHRRRSLLDLGRAPPREAAMSKAIYKFNGPSRLLLDCMLVQSIGGGPSLRLCPACHIL